MESNVTAAKYLTVVCEDYDGTPGNFITVARFKVDEMQKAIDLLVAIAKVNGSARIEYEEF